MTTAAAPPRRYVPEDLLCMEDRSYELLDGRLVERQVSTKSSETASIVGFILRLFLRESQLGRLFDADLIFAIFPDPNRSRRADVSFIRRGRLSDEDFGVLRIAPDLVVEVMSPSNGGSEMRAKVDEWLEAGVQEVWVLYPNAREAYVYRSDAKPRVLTADDTIETTVLPGFATLVADLFPQPVVQPAEATP